MREIVTSVPGQPKHVEVIMSREELRELDRKQLEANGRIVALKAHTEILEGRIQALESKNDLLKRQVESWKDRHEIAREDVFAEEANVKERVQSEMAELRRDRVRLRDALWSASRALTAALNGHEVDFMGAANAANEVLREFEEQVEGLETDNA